MSCVIELKMSICKKLFKLYVDSCRVGREFAGFVFTSKKRSQDVEYVIGDKDKIPITNILKLAKSKKKLVEFIWHTHQTGSSVFSSSDLEALENLKIPLSLISEISFKKGPFKVIFPTIIFIHKSPFMIKDFIGIEKSIEYKGFYLIWIPLNPFLRFLQKLKWLFFGEPKVKGFIDLSLRNE